MKQIRFSTLLLLVASLMLLFWSAACTIIYDDDTSFTRQGGKGMGHEQELSAEDAQVLWETHVLAYIENEGLTISEAFAMHKQDGATTLCAVRDVLVVDELTLDTKSRSFAAVLQPAHRVVVQLGPIIKGTVLRDGTPTIDVNDFLNQIEFAAISREFNKISANLVEQAASQIAIGDEFQVEGILQINGDEGVLTLSSLTATGN